MYHNCRAIKEFVVNLQYMVLCKLCATPDPTLIN